MFKRKGFTLVELLAVVAILGILVLIAAPNYNDKVGEAEMAQIVSDIRKYETKVEFESIKNVSFKEDNFKRADLNQYLFKSDEENFIYSEEGLFEGSLAGDFWEIDKKKVPIDSPLKGVFLIDSIGNVYYIHEE